FDITEQKNQARILEEKNRELERSNAELASFTYIASHDLQEPLRKIQTFTKRILEKEGAQFPEQITDYFGRIMTASKRMQLLIHALLDYSRTTATESQIEMTDLN